jgi:hypothetical protein
MLTPAPTPPLNPFRFAAHLLRRRAALDVTPPTLRERLKAEWRAWRKRRRDAKVKWHVDQARRLTGSGFFVGDDDPAA